MDNGWIKLHRKILDWGWYQDSKMVHLFLHFLMLANHEKGEWQGQTIERGQFITGRIELSKQTGITQQSIRTCITKLKSTNEITTKSTNKFTVITILKYNDYQIKPDKLTTKSTNTSTNEQPTTNQQLTTNKKNKNVKNDKKEQAAKPLDEINLLINIFQTTNPGINYSNMNTRNAAKWLIDKYGFEKSSSMCEYAVMSTGKPFAPVITTPYQLKENLGKLVAFSKREMQTINKPSKTLTL